MTDAFVTEIEIPMGIKFRQLREWEEDLDKISKSEVYAFRSKTKLRIYVVESDHLGGNTPSGTHEFCRGFLVARRMLQVLEAVDRGELIWQAITISDMANLTYENKTGGDSKFSLFKDGFFEPLGKDETS